MEPRLSHRIHSFALPLTTLKHESISPEETLENESLVVAKIYVGRDRLGSKDRKLVEKLVPMHLKLKA
jgi:hypothetical protein